MHTKKVFTMFCFFCTGIQSIECATQKQAVTKFFDDGWRVRADEDVCPECEKLLPKRVLRRDLLSMKKRLLTRRAVDGEYVCPLCGDSIIGLMCSKCRKWATPRN